MANDTAPVVSVCVPTYGRSALLARTLRSVLAQTWSDFEIVVVDDASPDDTGTRVAELADPRVRYIRNERNLGPAETWNRALGLAQGKYIKLLCDDDLLYPRCLERQVAVFEDAANADVAVVACRRDIIGELDQRLFMHGGFGGRDSKIPGPAAVRRIVRSGTNPIGEPCATLFRASAVARGRGFDPHFRYMIDVDFWTRLLEEGALFWIGEALCGFRVTRNAWSARLARTQAREAREFFRTLRSRSRAEVTALDLLQGEARATTLGLLRRLFYVGMHLHHRG